ncbi:MAG: AraC family transcriptional regulator [Lachnospiraceae bacterium]|nr:AraC family transcriptional regulator [Lachnospiraceae bacterium]
MIKLEYHKSSNNIFSEFGCHIHTSYEIYYFVSGDVELMVEGRVCKLTPHSLIIFPPNVLHGCQVNTHDDYVRYCLYIDPVDILPERLPLLTSLVSDFHNTPQEILYEHTEAFNLEQFFYNLKQLEDLPKDVKDTMEHIFTEALIAQINLLCRTLRPSKLTSNASGKILDIVNYINDHITEPLTLDSISSSCFISKNYLNNNFKNTLGTTVIEYIRYKRVILAKQMIRNGESAMNAALAVGFADYSSFYRAYMKFLHYPPKDDIPTSLPS